jgi:phage terminase large subunit-like protein
LIGAHGLLWGGRGAGKTRAGAEWVRSRVEGPRPLDDGACSRVALVGETIDEVREVMIFGDSGIMACSPPYRRPTWQATRKRLVWPNGAIASVHTAHDPEGLRGPQFDAAWVDELAKWKCGQEAWDQLQFALLFWGSTTGLCNDNAAQCRGFEVAITGPVHGGDPCQDRSEQSLSGGIVSGGGAPPLCRDTSGPSGVGRCVAVGR